MNILKKIHIQLFIGLIWGLYTAYLIMFENLLLFPKDTYELFVPAGLQIAFYMLFVKLFKKEYTSVIKIMSLICCGLVILWHFSFICNISQGIINGLFVLAPIFSIIFICVRRKVQRESQRSVLRQLGVALLLGFVNFIIGVFSFYIFHYWI